MKKLYGPGSDVDLFLIQGILEGEGIFYFILNHYFGSLYPGPRIWLYNNKIIMVHEEDFERASELVSDYLQRVGGRESGGSERYSLFDKIRMVVEFFLFRWFIPGKSRFRKAI